ncbi:MAG: hypothetical protein A2X31_06445 [Elusimicrobia bacterium GWB2_63_22]|nr:MAG: hypothetical protein A2X31_06445 [Elusimicrobia bacterium GWB2_63_22]
MKNYMLAAACLLGLTACGTMKEFLSDADKSRIEARPNGAYAAIASDEDKKEATNYASFGAKNFCEKKGKTAVILGTTAKYDGLSTEKNDKLLKKASEAALLAGAPGKAALAADSMTDDALHEIQMEFKCE